MIPPISQWPKELMHDLFERVAIMHFDGGLPIAEAEQKAMRDVWPQKELV